MDDVEGEVQDAQKHDVKTPRIVNNLSTTNN